MLRIRALIQRNEVPAVHSGFITYLRQRLHLEQQAENYALQLVLTCLLAWALLWTVAPAQAEVTTSFVSIHLSCDLGQSDASLDPPDCTKHYALAVEQQKQRVLATAWLPLFSPDSAYSTPQARAPPALV
ncbi:hypothetical protein [Marinobacterium stanieri]|uniref:hypothetical protein n=1 Tax=Marinobacterium stanieri TaxID=49186 RepID=UPI003A8DC59E